jgi:hypothetical protein
MTQRKKRAAAPKTPAPKKFRTLEAANANNVKLLTEVTKGERIVTPEERALAAALLARRERRAAPPEFRTSEDGKTIMPAISDDDPTAAGVFQCRLSEATGGTHVPAMIHLMSGAANADPSGTPGQRFTTAASIMMGLAPRDELEGMLVSAMVGAHTLAMNMLGRAARTEHVDYLATYGNLATKLLRVFAQTSETLAQHRGQTRRQVVRVEHVHVEAGGQAVVGAVTTGGGGAG